jgi:hypothetical protein
VHKGELDCARARTEVHSWSKVPKGLRYLRGLIDVKEGE